MLQPSRTRTLFEVEVQSYPCRRPCNLLSQPLLELFHIRHQPLILGLHQCKIVSLQQLNV